MGKKEKYYPSSYIDDIKGIEIKPEMMDKDMEIKAIIRIKSANTRVKKDKDPTTDVNFEIRSIDFSPGGKKKETSTDLQDAIEEGLKK